MQRKQTVWVTVAVALAVTTATAADEAGPHVKGRGSVDQTQTKQLSPLEEVKSGGEPLPWRAEVSHARAGLPAWVTLKVRGVLGPGSLYLAGGDGTAVTFLASGHLNQVPGPLPVNRADPEGMREQTSQREGDIINGPGYESRHDDTRRPHFNSQFPEDTNGPTAAPVACPVFAMVNDDGLSHPQTPGYEVTCEAEGSGLILQATHVYSNPGQYLLEAHFLDDSLGVVTGRWQAQVEVEELLQVILGPSRAIPLRDGHAAAFATLSITPPAAPLPLPCPGGLIAWAWDFGDSTGAERGECTSEERAKEEGERMIQEEERGVGRDLEDFLRDAEKRTENLTGLEESGGEGKKEVESTDKREREGGEPEGSREQKKDNPDSFAPSLSYFTTGSPSTTPASTDTPTSTTSTTSTFNTWDSVNDKYTSSTPDSSLSLTPPYPPTLPPGPTSSTVSGPTHAVSSLSSASATRVTSTESDDYPTTSTTATPDGGPFASTVTVRHTYIAPGIFNMSVWLLCGCRRITRKDISPAFTVAEPIRDVQISVSETHLLLIPGGLDNPPATQKVEMTVTVASGSLLHPLTLHTGDDTQVLLQPTRSDSTGPWVAQAKHKYHLAGEYRPWVEVANPVGRRRAVFHTAIKVDQPPDSVVLVPGEYLAAVGEEVVFRAEVSGGVLSASLPLHFDWLLPGGERLDDAGPVVTRTFPAPLRDTVTVQVYSGAHARTPGLPYPKATAPVIIEAVLTGVQVLVDGKDADVIVAKNKLVLLEAVVSPPEAVKTSHFFWYLNEKLQQQWLAPQLYYDFTKPGEVRLKVLVENRLSHRVEAVVSPQVRVLVVEKLGDVRGLTDHHSVHVRQARNYTVLVDHGSNITYTWHFGDFQSPVTTSVPTAQHTYWMDGTYTLTVSLTTPLGDFRVTNSKVFVLRSGTCDTPKVLGFYPKDTLSKREFDGTQEILVEPELLRNCPIGTGPEYHWTIWNEDGQKVPFWNTRLDTPSLLIHPVYDHAWPSWTRSVEARQLFGMVLRMPMGQQAVAVGALVPRTLVAGEYLTQLTVKENGTIVEASFNTTFSVVATRLRVTFVDGTEREVDRENNVTLRIEVASPSPNYNVTWACHPQGFPEATCFQQPDLLSTFPTTTKVGDTFFSRLRHLWELLYNSNGNNDNKNSHMNSYPFVYQKNSPPPPTEEDKDFVHNALNSSHYYIVSLTFPASVLLTAYTRFHFSVSVTGYHHLFPVNASQLVVVKSFRDNVGIQTCLGSQFPFGALRRMVFESECLSCSPEELAALRYSWSLKMVVSERSIGGSKRVPNEIEAALQQALQRVKMKGSFLPRPRDYLRVYNKSVLQEALTFATPEEDTDAVPASPTPRLSPRDLQNMPGVVTPEIMTQAAEIQRQRVGLRQSSQDAPGGPHRPLTTRAKRSLEQDDPALMLKVKKSSPSRPVGNPSVMDGLLSNDWEGGGGEARGSTTAPAAARHTQRRQMRGDDRTSSSQTNMRRKVVGRHSGEAAQGPVTDEAALPTRGSSTTPAFVKVTFSSHHSHLAHRTARSPSQGAEDGEGEAPTTHPPAAHDPPPRLTERNTVAAETEHQTEPTETPDHRRITERNSRAEKMIQTHEIPFEGPRSAPVRGVGHGGSRRSGVKWEAMGKVVDVEEATQQHQVIPSKGKVQENEYLKMREQEEEKEKEAKEKEDENRLWRVNDGDHPPGGGSSVRKEQERRPVAEAATRARGTLMDEHGNLIEEKAHRTITAESDAVAAVREASIAQEKATGVTPPPEGVKPDSLPPHHAITLAGDAPTAAVLKPATRKPDLPIKADEAREWQEPEWQGRQHPHRLDMPRSPSPPLVPPGSSPISVTSLPDNKEENQFPSDTNHAVRGSEGADASGLPQHLRGPLGKNRGGGAPQTKAAERPRQRPDLQGFRGKVKKQRKKEKLKNTKTERRKGGSHKGRQEVRGGGGGGDDAAPRHPWEQEVGYKENYLTSGVSVKVAEDDANDAQEAQHDVGGAGEARQVARPSRPLAHQHGDSAPTPVSPTPRTLSDRGGAAAVTPEAPAAEGVPWYEWKSSAARGVGGKVRGSGQRHSPPGAMHQPSPEARPAKFSSTTPLDFENLPTVPPRGPKSASSFRLLDYQEYMKLKMAELGHRKIDSYATFGSDQSTGNPAGKPDGQGGEGESSPRGLHPRFADGKAPNHTTEDGMRQATPAPQRQRARLGPADHLKEERHDALSLSPPRSSPLLPGSISPPGTPWHEMLRNQRRKVVETAGGDRSGSTGGGQGEQHPRGFAAPPPPPREGRVESSRGLGYQNAIADFVRRTGRLPDLSCREENWDKCDAMISETNHISETLRNTVGDPNGDSSVLRADNTEEIFETEASQVNVVFFGQLTSTGTHNPVLVLYMDLLSTSQNYVLYLNTYNTLTNNTGRAKQLIEFSPAPTLENCQVIPLSKGQRSYFRASCSSVEGHFYPVVLEWSYHFLWLGAKTIFYHGARSSFDFTLPPGLEANDYKMYISVKAIDGKGVSFRYSDIPPLQVMPRSDSGDGVLSIFQEISTIENESPPLLLQQVRSLAWELNILPSSAITQTVWDNILTILFYSTSCQDMLEAPTGSPVPSFPSSSDYFVKINLLKSCARDHLAEKVVSNPMRDELEVIQALTALQIIIDANENISSTTYLRVLSAMNIAADRMWFSYFAEVRTEAAEEYFILSSAMLDKQTETYDWNITSVALTTNIITQLLDIMEIETSARFREEKPIVWGTDTLTFYGYWAESLNINKWNNTVPFLFKPGSVFLGVTLVQALVHTMSPFNLPEDPITSEVVYLTIYMPPYINRKVEVTLRRSVKRAGPDYDFRRNGVLTPESLSVYEFEVRYDRQPLVLNVLLEVTRVLNSQYPVAAVVLICQDLQSLHKPLYKQELMATAEPSDVLLSVPPDGLPAGKMLLIIMDKNSYDNNWGRYNTSSTVIGADFKVSAWWSRCMVWNGSVWADDSCSVISKSSSWDSTVCSCNSKYSVYGAQTIPVLDEESKIDVNELMLLESYIALYFIILLLVVYFLLALALQTSDRHRLRRRNIWLRDNKLEHEWAYLLTIKTGTQWNAGTTSKVYAILHGTHGMSETRELQSKQTGQLFTRGALCTFILTTPEPLGDILKVQVWHDNSGGSESGWFVCETSVADLVLGAIYVYPCYRWLSVQAEDAKIEREITLESPTTFLQDFEHFLPQYASEHMLWTSLLTTSNTAKLYRLQRLTICLIVCLCMGTVALWVVKKINNRHTMMVPDMHIEPLYYGVIIAVVLLPIQWVLEMVFKMSNKLEEKEYNAKAVLDTLRASKSHATARTDDTVSSNVPMDTEDNVYDLDAEIWKDLRTWGLSTDLSPNVAQVLHPTLLRDLEADNIEVTQRLRANTRNVSRVSQSDSESIAIQSEAALPNIASETSADAADSSEESNKKCSMSFEALPKFMKRFGLQCGSTSDVKDKPCVREENWEAGEDEYYEDDDDTERDDMRVSSSITFIFSQCVGWIVCCIFVAQCCMVLYIYGSGMPMDYGALWTHIIYVTLCCSMFVMQPLVVVIYTFYKVCVYRWLGCRGCISSCITVPLDQVVDIWNRYQTALRRQTLTTPDNDNEKLLEERQRTRELRSAHPPSENYLLKCREKEIRREKVYSLFRNAVGHLALLMVLIILANNVNVYKRFMLNEAILSSLKNGSCLDTARYVDPCTLANGDNCNQIPNENYMTFEDIKTKDDWWQWAYTELSALTYSNHDESYSAYNIFCDTNSIIIGQPRLRKYDSTSQECEASKVKIDNNRSMADLLKIGNCFPDYVDEVSHLFSFGSNVDKEYEWDAHYLAVTHGQYSKYSYTSYRQDLPSSKFSADLMFYLLQANNWMDNNGTRAVVTEFLLYHPQTNLYTTLNLLAEFPSLSGAEMTVFISSSPIERYERSLAVIYMLNEAVLLGIAMYYLNQIAVYIYNCRLRIWKSYWGMLDVLMTLLSWSYIVCLMLRVQIAEDAMWQLRVAYFQKFVNLKGLTTWDGVLEALIGCMLTVHLLRCLSLVKYLPRSYRLGLVLASAWNDVKIISRYLLVFLIAFMCLGHTWFNTHVWEFHSQPETLFTLLKMVLIKLPFLKTVEHEGTGSLPVLSYLYYLLTYVFLYQLMRALYVAAFLNARRSFVDKPGLDVKWKDITFYVKERYQSLLGKICRKKKEEESHPDDNTPPDFYMAELELQINQVMSGLESLAESLGVVVDRMNRLEDMESNYSDTNYSEEHLWRDNDCSYSNDETWQHEDSTSRTSTSLNERETKWDSVRHEQQFCVGEVDFKLERNCTEGARPRFVNEAVNECKMSVSKGINLDAFTDIESCQTEIEALTQKWNLAVGDPGFELLDDGGTLEKFLKDVSESFDNFASFGKYGKTQLRVNTRIHPSHESLNLSQNNSGVTENAMHQRGIHSEGADGTVPRGISSRLCKTQTQGRGKGQVDALDISFLESDHEDESNC